MASQRALPDFSDNLHSRALLHGYPTVPGQDEYPALRGNSVRHPVATSRPEAPPSRPSPYPATRSRAARIAHVHAGAVSAELGSRGPVLAEPVEARSLGNVLVQARGSGVLDRRDPPRVAPERRCTPPGVMRHRRPPGSGPPRRGFDLSARCRPRRRR
jgi:hypothetical protein